MTLHEYFYIYIYIHTYLYTKINMYIYIELWKSLLQGKQQLGQVSPPIRTKNAFKIIFFRNIKSPDNKSEQNQRHHLTFLLDPVKSPHQWHRPRAWRDTWIFKYICIYAHICKNATYTSADIYIYMYTYISHWYQ